MLADRSRPLSAPNPKGKESTTPTGPDLSASKNKLSRRRQPKVRTGCYTCKLRHVKCDEAKPSCSRCIKFGTVCDGYPSSTSTAVSAASRAILPKGQALARKRLEGLPLCKMNSGPRFENVREGQYFRLYCEEMARQIRGPFPTALWDQLIPQISEAEPFIKHAIIGIGALGKTSKDASKSLDFMGNLPPWTPDSASALEHYGKALRGMRASIARGDRDYKTFCLACILIFIFETLYAQPGSAVKNAESALMLLSSWSQAKPNERTIFFKAGEWREQQIEEDLLTALGGLDLQVLFFRDTRPISVHEHTIGHLNTFIPDMPIEFTTLKCARKYWQLIMRRNFHWRKVLLLRSKCEELSGYWKYSSDSPWDDCTDIFPGGNMFSTPKEPPADMYSDMVRYREDIRRWGAASSRLFENLWADGNPEEKVLVALLRMHEIISHIMLEGAFFITEIEHDVFFPQYRTILSLLEYIHPIVTATGASFYQFDLGIIIGLFLLGTRCRERQTRNRAIEIMLSKRFREGMWDVGPAAMLSAWIRDVEEEAREENGDLPEHKRGFITSILVDLARGRGIMGLTKKGLNGLEFLEKEYHVEPL